jgi:GDP-D-mannose 3', 5'-epimerase
MKTAIVLGAGGFIGSHLVQRLKNEGYWVRGVDLKYPEFEETAADEFVIRDLRDARSVETVLTLERYQDGIRPYSATPTCFADCGSFDEVYQLAADMGGAGYIFTGEHDADVMHNSGLINMHVAYYATKLKAKKVFYSSSACMYPSTIQEDSNNPGLPESSAYPANPDSEYGWEKLFSERLYLSFARNYALDVRIARFHNIFGPKGTYTGGREKAPAASCRKVVESKDSILIWGDGEQTRSFLYIDDCIDAVRLLMESSFTGPVNIGSEEMVSINELTSMACGIAKKKLEFVHDLTKPQGVRGRNSDNTLIRQKLNWEPKYSLLEGMRKTFEWIESQMLPDKVKTATPKVRTKKIISRSSRKPQRKRNTGRSRHIHEN